MIRCDNCGGKINNHTSGVEPVVVDLGGDRVGEVVVLTRHGAVMGVLGDQDLCYVCAAARITELLRPVTISSDGGIPD